MSAFVLYLALHDYEVHYRKEGPQATVIITETLGFDTMLFLSTDHSISDNANTNGNFLPVSFISAA